MTDDAPRTGIVAALAAFQAELPTIEKKSKANTGTFAYSYADLADVAHIVLPLLARHGIAFTAPVTLHDDRLVVEAMLMHAGGETIECQWPVALGSSQSMGSAVTYARRYCLLALTGVHPQGEDDDGAAAEHRKLARDTIATPKKATRSRTTRNGGDDPWQVPLEAQPATVPPATDTTAYRMSEGQQKLLGGLYRDLGLGNHRQLALAVTGKIIGRVIESRTDLSQAETVALIDTLQAMRANERWVGVFQALAMAAEPLVALEDMFPGVIDDYALSQLYADQIPFGDAP